MNRCVQIIRSGNYVIKGVCVSVCARTPDGDTAQDVCDFSWDDYLEETEAVAVPHHAFKHVGADNLRSQHTASIHNLSPSICVQSNSLK